MRVDERGLGGGGDPDDFANFEFQNDRASSGLLDGFTQVSKLNRAPQRGPYSLIG